MKYLFDTDAVSFFYDATRTPEHLHIKSHVATLHDKDVLQVSVLTLYEFEYSYCNATASQKLGIRNTIEKIEQTFVIIPLKRDFSRTYGEIKSLLKHSTGRKAKEMKRYNIDLLIASTAIAESSIVIGSDRIYRELASLYPRFRSENWFI
jgi:predicted nucleic acid-binding protein